MKTLSFRNKVLLLAVALVAIIQLGTLVPVLGALKRNQNMQADRAVGLAGVVFDEFMQNRTAQLTTTVDVLVADFAFRDAVGSGDVPTIASVLKNHAARAGTDTAVVFDLNGNVVVSTGVGHELNFGTAVSDFIAEPGRTGAIHSVSFIDGAPYETVTVPVRAPVTIAWVMLAFPLDRSLAEEISALTGLEASFVRFGLGKVDSFASTLTAEQRSAALGGVHLGDPEADASSLWGQDFITTLRPFLREQDGVYVALQLSMIEATASYRTIRGVLILITSIAMLLAIAGAVWISRMVTQPVQGLVEAARRMREGIYNQPISIASRDEFGDLAAGFNSMQEAIANRERHIFHMAHHDSLSGLPMRDLVVGRLRDTLGEVEQLAVVNISLTRFDGLASSLGHRVADRVIELVAGQLRSSLEDDQILGHLNHHEFVLILPGFGRDRAEDFARRVKSTLRAGVKVGDANISLQATAGLATYPEHGEDAAELLRLAAIARNDGSHHVESVVTYQREQEDRALQLIRIVGDFPRALQNQELELEFQPQVDCNNLTLIGAEALVRWQHPELGRLAPDTFIEAIVQAGGISHLTRWVIREAIRSCAAWRSSGLDISIAVNISADDLVDEYLPHFLCDLTDRHGLDPSALTLEVTEGEIIHNVQTSLAIVTCLRELGFRIAIDDFGTGHSSLAQLKRLPVDELKIDKSFVLNMSNRRDEAVVRAAIELAHQFGLTVLAEGVENESSLARLRQLGCESAQGYHFGRPMPQHDFLRWAAAWAETGGSDIVALVEAGAEA